MFSHVTVQTTPGGGLLTAPILQTRRLRLREIKESVRQYEWQEQIEELSDGRWGDEAEEGIWGHPSLCLDKVGGTIRETPALEEDGLGGEKEISLHVLSGGLCDVQAEMSPSEFDIHVDLQLPEK